MCKLYSLTHRCAAILTAVPRRGADCYKVDDRMLHLQHGRAASAEYSYRWSITRLLKRHSSTEYDVRFSESQIAEIRHIFHTSTHT